MAIRQKTTIKQRMKADGLNHALTKVTVRDVGFAIDEPIERGGTNTGPAPTETALGALLGCTNVIGSKCAAKLGIDIGHLKITAVWDLDRRGVLLDEEIEVPFVAIHLTVIAEGSADQAGLDRVAAETAKFCPVAKLFEAAGTKLTIDWQKSPE